jgi:hypothetical protein
MILGKNLSRLIFGSDSETTKTASQEFSHEEVIKISQGLEKVASYDYSPETYSSLIGMMKIASKCKNSMDSELSNVRESVQELEKKAEIRIIIDDMVENGLTDSFDVEEKVASLLKKDDSELKMVKEAMSLAINMSSGNFFEDMDKTASASNRRKEIFEGIL